MKRRLFYGWFDARTEAIRVSAYPPDCPIRPSLAFASKADVKAMLDRRRADIIWSPPLPAHLDASDAGL